MKTIILALFTMLGAQLTPIPSSPNIPKNNPNGVWVSESGTKFRFELSGKDLKVQLVDGQSRYLKYDLMLKNQEEVNTYSGSGTFVAKLSNGKECKFDTAWNVVIIQTATAFVSYNRISPDPDTCAIASTTKDQLFLKKDVDSK